MVCDIIPIVLLQNISEYKVLENKLFFLEEGREVNRIKEGILNVVCSALFPIAFGVLVVVCMLGDSSGPKVGENG